MIVSGIDLHVAGINEGLVVITESGGNTSVREGGGAGAFDSYLVRLSRAPVGRVYVTVSANPSNLAERTGTPAGDTIWLCTGATAAACDDAFAEFRRHVVDDGTGEDPPQRAVVLVFDAATWATAQTVWVYAHDDTRPEGDRVVVINHSTIALNAADQAAGFDGTAVRNVEVLFATTTSPASRSSRSPPAPPPRTAPPWSSRARRRPGSPTTSSCRWRHRPSAPWSSASTSPTARSPSAARSAASTRSCGPSPSMRSTG